MSLTSYRAAPPRVNVLAFERRPCLPQRIWARKRPTAKGGTYSRFEEDVKRDLGGLLRTWEARHASALIWGFSLRL